MKQTKGIWKNELNEIYSSASIFTLASAHAVLGYRKDGEPEISNEQAQANASYICLAVNNHDKLAEALREAQEAFKDAGLNIHADWIESLLSQLK